MRPWQVGTLVATYYATSMLSSCLTKLLLVEFPFPLSVSLVQQLVASAGSTVEHSRRTGSWHGLRQWRSVTPVAGALVVAGVSYRVSLVYSPVSFAQAIKTLQPLFATALSRSLLKEQSSRGRLASLALLVVGVATATATEIAFSAVGFAAALLSGFAQALQMVLTKRLLLVGHILRMELFAAVALYTLLLLTPCWLVLDGPRLLSAEAVLRGSMGGGAVALLMLLTSLCAFANQWLGFAVLCALASPVSTAVVSTFKRVVVIVASVLWFQTPITLMHACGVGAAVVAVSMLQSGSSRALSTRTPLLPRVASEAKCGPGRAV